MILIHFLTFLQAEALDVFVVKTKKEEFKDLFTRFCCASLDMTHWKIFPHQFTS